MIISNCTLNTYHEVARYPWTHRIYADVWVTATERDQCPTGPRGQSKDFYIGIPYVQQSTMTITFINISSTKKKTN